MSSLDLKSLIDKLSPLCRRTLEEAAGLCVSRTHYNVEIEHLLAKLLALPEGQDTDLRRALRQYEIDRSLLVSQVEEALGRFDTGSSRTPAFSPQILQLFREAWLATSLQLKSPAVRTGSLLLALLDNDLLRGVAVQSVPALGKIPRDHLRENASSLFRGSVEDVGAAKAPAASAPLKATPSPASQGEGEREEGSGEPSATPALDQFTLDLTARARAGEIDPIRGRDAEIRQVIDILSRRRQNNPILVGEAGVGKTAVVEGLALRIAAGDVPPSHRNISLRLLDLGLLQAGASMKGEFESRLKTVIDEVKGSPKPIILFIDEAHTMIGAGGAAGQGDAANLLKPALARGELRTIAATTWAEYKKYFEKDPALARRFQVVKVGEPSEEAAVDMLRGLAVHLEEHHDVRVLDEAIRDAVGLSHRYITGRQLPDKAISVLDTACARVALGLNGTPPAVENVLREIDRLELEIATLKRERAAGQPPSRRMGSRTGGMEELGADLARLKAKRAELEDRWKRELALAKKILDLQAEADQKGDDPAEAGRLATRISRLREELRALQGEDPMVPVWVDSRVVAAVISAWTGIPAGKMMTDEIHSLLSLRDRMGERVVGQGHALEAIARRINTSRAQLEDPSKPIGVFLLVGPSGVGKTETALTLADVLYGGARNMVTVNMSEFQEAHSVSTLKGAPPGYVGYGTGGVLTEAVRRNPYTVILLDEMEKAHRDVAELFYQVFDKGLLEDGEGVPVDFKNTVILLTSNVGSELIARLCRDGDRPEPAKLVEEVRPALLRHFPAAFLGRVAVVPYYPLGEREIREIVELKLARIRERIRAGHHAELTYGEELVEAIAGRCTEVESGARNVDHILTQTLLPELSSAILERMAAGEGITRVHVGLDDAGGFAYVVR
ncbi:MAG: type VI secretion system ATPase TssH [Thermoanaerobaculia bacterium]